jgi:fluoroquinolone resistance protein
MEPDFVDKTYDRIDFKESLLAKGDYEAGKFTNCDFSNTELSEMKFIDCEFAGCNLSLAKLSKTVFRGHSVCKL